MSDPVPPPKNLFTLQRSLAPGLERDLELPSVALPSDDISGPEMRQHRKKLYRGSKDQIADEWRKTVRAQYPWLWPCTTVSISSGAAGLLGLWAAAGLSVTGAGVALVALPIAYWTARKALNDWQEIRRINREQYKRQYFFWKVPREDAPSQPKIYDETAAIIRSYSNEKRPMLPIIVENRGLGMEP